MEAGGLPRVVIVVTNPLDILTEYLVRRWHDRSVSIMGSGTSLDTLRFEERLAKECGVHPRSIHAWVIGEHGDSSVFLFSSAHHRRAPLHRVRRQQGIKLTASGSRGIEDDVRTAAYRVRELKGSPRHGIGLAVERPHALHRSRARLHHPGVGARGRRRVRQPSVHPRSRRRERSRCGR